MSQEALAHEIGCASSLIHKWEQCKRVPSGFMFACWIDALEAEIKIEIKETT
jgi:ribosome-binding protein aMBF1 (putative translation factor)